MCRALLLFERQPDASWLPTTVILATPKGLQGNCLPGDPDRAARLTSLLQNALPPRMDDFAEERGTYEDWVDWALNLANGHTTWATEVVPTATVEALYQREMVRAVATTRSRRLRHSPPRQGGHETPSGPDYRASTFMTSSP